MPEGLFGTNRPGADSTLLLVIQQNPVPTGDIQELFPPNLIRKGADEQSLIDDISNRTVFTSDEISIDTQNKLTRGLGQTDTYNIKLNVSGMTPSQVDSVVQTLVDAGYMFKKAEFE